MFLKLKTDLDQMILIENYYNVSQKKILLLLCIRGFYLNILTQLSISIILQQRWILINDMHVIKVMPGTGSLRTDARMFALYPFTFRYRYPPYSHICFVALVNGCNISSAVPTLQKNINHTAKKHNP